MIVTCASRERCANYSPAYLLDLCRQECGAAPGSGEGKAELCDNFESYKPAPRQDDAEMVRE